jgi:orotidine-5'-phosphate decarboxylase
VNARDKIIVALDASSREEAEPLIQKIAPHVGCFKIGLELITALGAPEAVQLVHQYQGGVFFDGKFADIPNTVGKAAAVVSHALKVRMFNLHASCGIKAMQAAVRASNGLSIVLAVSVLTSLDEENAHLIFGAPVKAKVLQFARDATSAGCDGIICSPQELAFLAKHEELKSLAKVTPGIRPCWAVANDQERITTPGDAIRAGATMLVVGRPITNPPAEIGDPLAAVRLITEEIEQAMQTMPA